MGSFRPSRRRVSGEVIHRYKAANDTGGGFDGAAGVTMYVEKKNGEIVTTLLVDIEDLVVSGTTKDVIGENGVAAAYITQIKTARSGVIYKAEMNCVEAPAGSNTTADIDLVTNSASLAEDVEYDDSGSAIVLIAAGGAYTKGMQRVSMAGTNFGATNNDYLYLANGSGANSGGTYTAGKFVIKLYGAAWQ